MRLYAKRNIDTMCTLIPWTSFPSLALGDLWFARQTRREFCIKIFVYDRENIWIFIDFWKTNLSLNSNVLLANRILLRAPSRFREYLKRDLEISNRFTYHFSEARRWQLKLSGGYHRASSIDVDGTAVAVAHASPCISARKICNSYVSHGKCAREVYRIAWRVSEFNVTTTDIYWQTYSHDWHIHRTDYILYLAIFGISLAIKNRCVFRGLRCA